MGKRVDIAERLKALGVDPVEGMVRIAQKAEATGNLALAGKMLGDLLEYTAPKLKAMEFSIEPETRDFLDRQQRRQRIKELARQTGITLEGEVVGKALLHVPEEP